MPDIEKVIQGIERCLVCSRSVLASAEAQKAYLDCEYTVDLYCGQKKLLRHALEVMKEQQSKRLVDVDELRKELGFSENCENCKQNTRSCQYDSHFSLMDFCERFDTAIETILERNKNE